MRVCQGAFEHIRGNADIVSFGQDVISRHPRSVGQSSGPRQCGWAIHLRSVATACCGLGLFQLLFGSNLVCQKKSGCEVCYDVELWGCFLGRRGGSLGSQLGPYPFLGCT